MRTSSIIHVRAQSRCQHNCSRTTLKVRDKNLPGKTLHHFSIATALHTSAARGVHCNVGVSEQSCEPQVRQHIKGDCGCLTPTEIMPIPASTHLLHCIPRISGRVQMAEPWHSVEKPVSLLTPVTPLYDEVLTCPGQLQLEPQPSFGPGTTENTA